MLGVGREGRSQGLYLEPWKVIWGKILLHALVALRYRTRGGFGMLQQWPQALKYARSCPGWFPNSPSFQALVTETATPVWVAAREASPEYQQRPSITEVPQCQSIKIEFTAHCPVWGKKVAHMCLSSAVAETELLLDAVKQASLHFLLSG